ncbi:MAG: GNAT family N-acetyltransferase [Candidatus Limnocylindrales bacterium]|jgi:ribosomal protein S18 acetylase RimI-like enzyme
MAHGKHIGLRRSSGLILSVACAALTMRTPERGPPVDVVAIHAYLRASARRWRECEQIGPFLASYSRTSSNPYLNYAIPDDGAEPSARDVTELIDAYVHRGLKPRLEYIPDLAPAVEPALIAAGFKAEGRLALMGFGPDDPGSAVVPAGIELVAPDSDGDLHAVRLVQHEAYEEADQPGEQEVRSLRRSLASGGGAVLARTVVDRIPVGAGEYTPIVDGVTEVTSIGVRPAYRRRGIAAAMTSWLARAAHASAATTLFLMASEDEERIYARVGFVTEGRVLHISR